MDRKAIEEVGIPSLILMENAGIACAGEVLKLAGRKGFREALLFCGKGNNGGDGFAAARHLYNKGLKTAVFFFQNPSEMKPDPLTNFGILEKMKIPLVDCSRGVDWKRLKRGLSGRKAVVDALFGTGLAREVGGPFRQVIQLINDSGLPVVAVDVPSGLNADTGEAMGVCVRADVTVTLGRPKIGFKKAKGFTGRVVVADISIPRVLYE
ncbi:MAG: NAD(P)H-hydrate epimerase [Candidatus Omnitrophica bacterium]|nr:NAD(P)H-hydrate epimerase [Candidatus Omnitrophota bacterium]